MSPSLLALACLGLLLGFRHAFEPDHLAAVSTLATRQGRLLDACRLGLAWALGHTASVGVVVAVIMLFGLHLPDRLWPAADFLVALHGSAEADQEQRGEAVGGWPRPVGPRRAEQPPRARTSPAALVPSG